MNQSNKIKLIQKDYIIIDKKDIGKKILENPFITISKNTDKYIEKKFLKIIRNKLRKKNELYIIFNNFNKEFIDKYSNKEIWHQFKIDILRSEFYINNIRIINPSIGKKMIIKRYKNYSNILAYLCTQGALSFIIKKLQLAIIKYNYFIAELSSNSNLNNNDKRVMKIFFNFITNTIIIKKNLRIIKINNNNNLENIKFITLIIEFKFNLNFNFNINKIVHIKIF